jgi:TPR repeat protein
MKATAKWMAVMLVTAAIVFVSTGCSEGDGSGEGDRVQRQKEDIAAVKLKAEGGDADAQFQLGQAYANRSVEGAEPADGDKNACEWWQKAADQGHAEAAFELALRYMDPMGASGVKADPVAATKYLKIAKENGHEKAAEMLADMRAERM